MREKLEKFTEFANDLLPHEIAYLMSVQEFQSDENVGILEIIRHNALNPGQLLPFDPALDKRRYSNLKLWIVEKLEAVDVDRQFEEISTYDRKIVTDAITPEDEKALIRKISRYEKPFFYDTRFYDMLLGYRHYLQIRLRHKNYRIVHEFLERRAADYQRYKDTYAKMHEVTEKIVNQYSGEYTETTDLIAWLKEVFYDPGMDGLNRYMAIIRLTFIYVNYRKTGELLKHYAYLDELFQSGEIYSRRLLFNYYANRVLIHTKREELDKAETYGYLSIRQHNEEYLQYVNNLCAVLLRQGKRPEALQLMQKAFPEMRKTENYHNKIGFVAFYQRALSENGRAKDAEKYADSFLMGYRDEVFAHRWHLFFATYLYAMLVQEKFDKILKVARKYSIASLDASYRQRPAYLPSVDWYIAVAEWREGRIREEDLNARLESGARQVLQHEPGSRALNDLMAEVEHYAPEAVRKLRERIA